MKVSSINYVANQYNKIRTHAVQNFTRPDMGVDRVEFSPGARLFSEAFAAARKSLQEAAPEQQVRMQQVMEQLRNGSYYVDTQDICDKLLS